MTAFHPVDVHVGNRLRTRRRMLNLSQTALAEAAKITFQQVQKYERGANRVSASRLWQFGQVLGVTPAFFFEGLGAGGAGGDPELDARDAARRAVADQYDVAMLLGRLADMGPGVRAASIRLVGASLDAAGELVAAATIVTRPRRAA